MKTEISLDDLMLLLAVEQAGALAGAARATGVSVPTLSRRMTALEQALGRRLFERGAQGYTLTADGRAVAAEAAPLRATAARLAAFRDGGGITRVRLTAGMWTSRFLARALPPLGNTGWILEFLSSAALLDLARREADIGIRNRRPDQPWLAGRKTGLTQFAFYGAHQDPDRVVTRPMQANLTASERWLHENTAADTHLYASDLRVALDLARAGQARMLLPCFVGETEDGLTRLSRPIGDLAREEWVISHHEARNDPPVRAALDMITRVLTDRSLRPQVVAD